MPIVRIASLRDTEALFELASLLSPRFIIEKEAFTSTYAQLLDSKDVYLRVIEESEAVIGYLLGWSRLAFYSNGPVGWVQEIVVHPDFRRRKAGKLLMDDFEKWMVLRGGRLVSLATRGASDFYLALEYVESATYYKKLL